MGSRRRRIGGHRVVRAAVMAAALSTMAPGAGEAQAVGRVDALETGRRSIALALPGEGSGEFSIWKMASDTRNRGLKVSVSASAGSSTSPAGSGDTQSISNFAGPAFRRYLSRAAPVAPYLQTSVLVGGSYRRHGVESATTTHSGARWTTGGELAVGIGAEWFPHRRASIGGHTGLRFNGFYRDERDAHHWQIGAGTMTSALSLQLYF